MPLFIDQPFRSHAGLELDWKIECDALTDEDIATLAAVIGRRLRFGRVVGIPRGGLRLSKALLAYLSEGPTLIVDDVLTTGASLWNARTSETDIGVVIFARGPCPEWVIPLFLMEERWQ